MSIELKSLVCEAEPLPTVEPVAGFNPFEIGLGPIDPEAIDSFCEAPLSFGKAMAAGLPWFCKRAEDFVSHLDGGSCPLPAADLNRMYAIYSLESESWPAALYWLNPMIDEDPLDPALYLARGVAQGHLGNLAETLADFEKVYALDPLNGDVLFEVAKLRLNFGEENSAEQALIEYSQFKPSDLEAQRLLGQLQATLGKYEDSIRTLNQVIEANEKDGEALLFRGVSFANLGKFFEAYMDFKAALVIDPTNATALQYLDHAYRDWQESSVR